MLKRPRDAFDTSPASSTPPDRPGKAVKRYRLDSDAFSDASTYHVPSDSPSNPFGRFKIYQPRGLPSPRPVADHLVLRFQLSRQKHSVHRIVVLPPNYTFWHLHRLTQFLFKWRDYRVEKDPENKHRRVQRRAEHVFTIKKRVAFHSEARLPGLFKDGTDVIRVARDVKELKSMCRDDLPWEREENYTLNHLWGRPGSSSNATRGIAYDYDIFSYRRATVHISLYEFAERVKASLDDAEDESNLPHVVMGSGLPDDDDDDEDFALDLQQFNDAGAFEAFLKSQEDADQDEEDDCPSIVRIAQEQRLAKQRMMAALPEHLPLDDDDEPQNETAVPEKSSFIAPPRPGRLRRISKRIVTVSDAEEDDGTDAGCNAARELSPVKRSTVNVASYPPEAEETEVCAGSNLGLARRPQIAVRKRAPLAPRYTDPEGYGEVADEHPRMLHKRSMSRVHQSDDTYDARPALRNLGGQAVAHVQRRRMPLESRAPDEEDDVEVAAAPRKRINALAPRHHNAEDEIRARARHVIESRRRVTMVARLPDPDESREIGDDRPSKPIARDRRASLPPLLGMLAAEESDDEEPQDEEEYVKAGPFVHRRRHAPLRGAPVRRRSVGPRISVKVESDDEAGENEENSPELVESEVEV